MEAEHISTAELLELECEILMPAATENQITTHNADRIKCRILAEGANGPTTADADEIHLQKYVVVIVRAAEEIGEGPSGKKKKLLERRKRRFQESEQGAPGNNLAFMARC